jgi:chemotaxis protein MotB
MAKRKKDDGGGVPEWVVTFGDMMSLLLCFFILLQMFSELKQDHEYQRVVTAVKEAFGYSGGIGVLPTNDPPLRSIIEQLEEMALRQQKELQISNSQTKGVDGPEMRVTKVRDGIVFTLGGPSMFEPGSAELTPPVLEQLEQLAKLLAGRNNKISVRGHASPMYLPEDSPFDDLDDLSWHRAKNVTDALVGFGLDDRVFRMEAVGTREPVRPRAINPQDAAENRRVEVIQNEQTVDDLNSDADYADPELARGG